MKIERNWKILDEVIAISKEVNKTPAQVINSTVFGTVYIYRIIDIKLLFVRQIGFFELGSTKGWCYFFFSWC